MELTFGWLGAGVEVCGVGKTDPAGGKWQMSSFKNN